MDAGWHGQGAGRRVQAWKILIESERECEECERGSKPRKLGRRAGGRLGTGVVIHAAHTRGRWLGDRVPRGRLRNVQEARGGMYRAAGRRSMLPQD